VSDDAGDITILLRRWHAGDHEAGEEIFRRLEKDLKIIAARCLARENRKRKHKHTLQRTDLFIEAFIRLAQANEVVDWRDRGHFFAISTIKLRHFLIDRARRKRRPDSVPIDDLPEGLLAKRDNLEVRIVVDELMDELEKTEPMTCAVLVASRYMGYEDKEIAEIFKLPLRTVQRHLHNGRKWLFKRLKKDNG
jgi:RNA polymerase sigma factor (TIGR02999 family)